MGISELEATKAAEHGVRLTAVGDLFWPRTVRLVKRNGGRGVASEDWLVTVNGLPARAVAAAVKGRYYAGCRLVAGRAER